MTFLVRMPDDGMAPALGAGDFAHVDPDEPAEPGRHVAVHGEPSMGDEPIHTFRVLLRPLGHLSGESMEVALPAAPRRPNQLRPLLPSGPDGVDTSSPREDRYGDHRPFKPWAATPMGLPPE